MLRQNGFRGRVVMFTNEGTLPYDRVRCPHTSIGLSTIAFLCLGSIIQTTHETAARSPPSRSVVLEESSHRSHARHQRDEHQLGGQEFDLSNARQTAQIRTVRLSRPGHGLAVTPITRVNPRR